MRILNQKIETKVASLLAKVAENKWDYDSVILTLIAKGEGITINNTDYIKLDYKVLATISFPNATNPDRGIVSEMQVFDYDGVCIATQLQSEINPDDFDDCEFITRIYPLEEKELAACDSYYKKVVSRQLLRTEELTIGKIYYACGRLESGDQASYGDPRNYSPVVFLGGSTFGRINKDNNVVAACDVRNILSVDSFAKMLKFPPHLLKSGKDEVLMEVEITYNSFRTQDN